MGQVSMFEAVSGGNRRILTVDDAAALLPAGLRLRVLLLADDMHPADVVLDHIESIKRHSRHDVTVVNPIRNRRGWLIGTLRFDIILIHYSICILYDYFLPPRVSALIKAFAGPKIQIIQDEYRWVDRMSARMADLGIRAVFSSLSPENILQVYHHEHLAGIRFFSGLPGYVSERLRSVSAPPISERPFHLVYRGRPVPIWLGKFSREKVCIGLQALDMAEKYGLNVDCKVREEDRVYGSAWKVLLMAGRAALATEGGATVFDFDESVEKGVAAYHREHPAATDDEVWEAIVKPYEGNVVHKTITPRVLEAIMYRTALVMYPGQYRGVIEPWEHYIPLERDGSNEAEVVTWLKDEKRLEEMVERAYRRLVGDPRLQFTRYVAAIDHVADELAIEAGVTGRIPLKTAARSAARASLRPLVRFAEPRMSASENPQRLFGSIKYALKRSYWKLAAIKSIGRHLRLLKRNM
jgi:hypothetical protein